MNDSVATSPTYSHREILTVIGVLMLSILLAALDQTIVSTALPSIAGALNGFEQISWLVTAYLLAQTIAMPIYGKLGDLFGRKPMLLSAIAIFLLGSVAAGSSLAMEQLIAARVVQGIGAGGLMVTAFAVMADVIPARDRGKYLAFMMPIFGLATVFGPTLGGFFVDQASWRWIFFINIPIGVIAIWTAWKKLHLPRPTPTTRHIDYAGAALLGIAMTGFVLLATWGGSQYAWDAPLILSLIGASVLAFLVFLRVEQRAADPIFPLTLFRNRTVVMCMLLGLVVGLALFGSLTYLPTFLQIAHDISPTASGLRILPLSLGLFAAAIVTGQLISRTGRYKIFPIVGTISASVGMYLLTTISETTPLVTIQSYMFFLGAGVGLVMPVLTQVAQNAVSPTQVGVATSSVNLARQLSGALGVSIAGALLTSRLHTQFAATLPEQVMTQLGGDGARIDPALLHSLPSESYALIANIYGTVLPDIFFVFVPVLCIGILCAFLLPELPLATETRTGGS